MQEVSVMAYPSWKNLVSIAVVLLSLLDFRAATVSRKLMIDMVRKTTSYARTLITALFFAPSILLSGCQTYAPGYNIYTDVVPFGSLRVGEVVEMGTRDDILAIKDILPVGVDDSDLVDGSYPPLAGIGLKLRKKRWSRLE